MDDRYTMFYPINMWFACPNIRVCAMQKGLVLKFNWLMTCNHSFILAITLIQKKCHKIVQHTCINYLKREK